MPRANKRYGVRGILPTPNEALQYQLCHA